MPNLKPFVFISFIFLILFSGCHQSKKHKIFSKVTIEDFVKDSTLNVRAIAFNKDYLFYGSKDHFGRIDLTDFNTSKEIENYTFKFEKADGSLLHFRAVEEVNGDLFAVSIESPARLYKLKRKAAKPKMVYQEKHPKAFYDAIAFWNKNEGIAMGDPTEGCISIIITRDKGETWRKLPCSDLPESEDGEAAFAASNTNIAIVGSNTWIATGGIKSRVLYSPDKGKTWQFFETPMVQGKSTTGIYSIDFYDEKHGFAIGGDYTRPEENLRNKIRTSNGGKTWEVVANGKSPGYRSCVKYVPTSEAKALVTVGFKGIDYSCDAGNNWIHLSDEPFYTIKFINKEEAYAAGNGRLSKLVFN